MTSRHLDADDLEWALDNSRRRYRVRPTRHGDSNALKAPAPANFITVIRLRDGLSVAMRAQCELSPKPWIDSDAYADHRLLLINRSHALRGLGDFAKGSRR